MVTITFTDAACEYIQTMLKKKNGIGFRLSIKKTGCSGYSYASAILTQENNEDFVMMTQNGVKIFVDKTWRHLLDGIEVDYIEENKNGLKQKRLTFKNPHEANRCGCGESFHVP